MLKSTLNEKKELGRKLSHVRNKLSTSKIIGGVFVDKQAAVRFPTVLESRQTSPREASTLTNDGGAQSHSRRQSIQGSLATLGSRSPLALAGDGQNMLQKNHRQRQLSNSFLGSHHSKASIANG